MTVDWMPDNVGLGTFIDEDKEDHEMLDFALIYVGAHNVYYVKSPEALKMMRQRPCYKPCHITTTFISLIYARRFSTTQREIRH